MMRFSDYLQEDSGYIHLMEVGETILALGRKFGLKLGVTGSLARQWVGNDVDLYTDSLMPRELKKADDVAWEIIDSLLKRMKEVGTTSKPKVDFFFPFQEAWKKDPLFKGWYEEEFDFSSDEEYNMKTRHLKPLEKEIEKRIGTPIKLSGNYLSNGNLKIESQNLISKAGILSNLMKSLVVYSAATGSLDDGTLWMTIFVKWATKDATASDTKLMTAWYNPKTDKWTYR